MQAMGLIGTTAVAEPLVLERGAPQGTKVIVLGAGMAGLSAAYELGKAGYDCVEFFAPYREDPMHQFELSPRELLARVKQDPDLCHIPVIVLTSSTRESDVRTCYGLHASCYLNKPGEFRQLAAMMKAIHDFWLLLVELPGRA